MFVFYKLVAINQRAAEVFKHRQWQAAMFLMNIRDNCNTSQVALNTIMNGSVHLAKVTSYSAIVRNNFSNFFVSNCL